MVMVNNQAQFKPILDLSKFADERWDRNYGICFDGSLAILTKSSDTKTTFWRFDNDVIQKLELPLSFACAPQALPDRSVLVKTVKYKSLPARWIKHRLLRFECMRRRGLGELCADRWFRCHSN